MLHKERSHFSIQGGLTTTIITTTITTTTATITTTETMVTMETMGTMVYVYRHMALDTVDTIK